MVVSGVWVQSRVSSFEKKSLVVIDFKTNDLDVFKVHVVAGMVDMACNVNFTVRSKLATAFLCSAIGVSNGLSVWP